MVRARRLIVQHLLKADLQLNYGSSVGVAELSADVATNMPGFGTNGDGQFVAMINAPASHKSQSQIFNLPNGTTFFTPGQTYEIALTAGVQLEGSAAPPTNGNTLPSLLGTADVSPVFSNRSVCPKCLEVLFRTESQSCFRARTQRDGIIAHRRWALRFASSTSDRVGF